MRIQAPVLRFEIGRLWVGEICVLNMQGPFLLHLKPELLHSVPAQSNGGLTPSTSLMPSIALSRMPENMKQEVLCTKLGLGNN